MNLREQLNLDDEKYGLLFDVRRSVRYHDRRRDFYSVMHKCTSFLTIMLAGSIFFDLAKPGDSPWWLILASVFAAVLSIADMVVGYSSRSNQHAVLRERFADLEISMFNGSATDEELWQAHLVERLKIEKDEPPTYVVVDLLCRNDLLIAEGFNRKDNPDTFANVGWFRKLTSHVLRWEH